MHYHPLSMRKNVVQLSNGSHFLLLKNRMVSLQVLQPTSWVAVVCRTSEEIRCAGILRNRYLALSLSEY